MNVEKNTAGTSYALLDNILESAFDGIILIDENGVIQRINDAVQLLFGYPPDELLGNNVNMLMPEPDHSAHDGYIRNYLGTGTKKVIGIGREVTGKRKDGSVFPFYLAVNEFSLDGKRFFTGIIHNLTDQKEVERQLKEHAENLERKVQERTQDLRQANENLETEIDQKRKAEKALLESQKMYKVISKNFPSGTINVFDRDLNYVFVQGKELDEIGITTEDLLGSSYVDRLDPSVRDEVQAKLKAVFAGTPDAFELEFKDNNYLLRAEPLFDLDGKVKQILVVETNITARKRVEEEMKLALKKERELNELKSRFVSMASHEFRTPLSAILSSASLISRYTEGDQQEKRLKHVERIRSNVNTLNLILEDFLSLEKLNEGVIKPTVTQLSMHTFFNDIKEEMEVVLPSSQYVDVVCSEADVELWTDKNILKNVFNNLISNASKYGKDSGKIELGVGKMENGDVHLWVRDFGMGIPKRDQSRIFARFFRASNALHIEGTGLGLNIVKRYVELLGGKIWFETELGQGTTFHITLPPKENE